MQRWSRTLCARMALVVACLLIGAGFPDRNIPPEAPAQAVERPQKRRAASGRRGRSGRAQRQRAQSGRGRGAQGRRATARNRRERLSRSQRRGRAYRTRGRGARLRGARGYRDRRGRAARGRRGGRHARRGRYARRNRAAAYAYRPTAPAASRSAPYRAPRSLVIPESRAREIQEKLKEAGFYQGEITGQYDESTREAMRGFQRANGLKETGTPTAPALLRLGLTKHSSEAGDTSAPPAQLPPPTDAPPPQR